jgi:hypothetical protein
MRCPCGWFLSGVPPDSYLAQKRSRAKTLRVIGIIIGAIFVVGLFYLAYLR